MSLNIDAYKARLGAYNTLNKNNYVNDMQFKAALHFEENPSYYNVLISDKEYGVHIVTYIDNSYKMLRKPNEITEIGEYIQWKSGYYLCIKTNMINDVQQQTTISYCNRIFTAQDTETGEIYEIPCILTDKTSVYSTGVAETTQLFLPDDQILVVIPDTLLNRSLVKKDKRHIFLNNHELVYKTTKEDFLVNNGLLYVKLKHDLYNPNEDNLELNVANYIEIDDEELNPDPDHPIDNYRIVIEGDEEIILGFNSKYTAKVYNNAVEVFDKEVLFTLKPITTTLATIKSQSDNQSVIEPNKKYNIGKITLSATLKENVTIATERELWVERL